MRPRCDWQSPDEPAAQLPSRVQIKRMYVFQIVHLEYIG